MNLDFTISKYPLIGTPFVGTIRAAIYQSLPSGVGPMVDFQDFAAPHTTSRAITFSDVESISYVIKIFAMPSAELLSWVQHPKQTSVEVKFPIFFKIGDGIAGTPAATTNVYSNSDLIGWEYWVERRGAGTLVDDVTKPYNEITKDAPAGTWTLALAGDQFSVGDYYVIHFLPKVTISNTESVISGKWFSGSKVIAADKTYDGSDFRKLLLLRPSASTITYTLPVGSTFPVGYVMAFNTYGIAATYVIQRGGSDNIEVGGAPVTSISLSRNQFLILVWDDITSNWEIVVQAGAGGSAITLSDNPDLNDGTKAASTVATKILADRIKIIYANTFNIGDVPPNGSGLGTGADPAWQITHSLAISGNYAVIGTIRSKNNLANMWKDNSVGFATGQLAANSFWVSMQEQNSDTQNITFDYILVKIP